MARPINTGLAARRAANALATARRAALRNNCPPCLVDLQMEVQVAARELRKARRAHIQSWMGAR